MPKDGKTCCIASLVSLEAVLSSIQILSSFVALESTNSAAVTRARNTLGDSQSMGPTQVAREEGVVADPDDTAAIETVGAAYEAWGRDIGYDPATVDMAGGALEGEE